MDNIGKIYMVNNRLNNIRLKEGTNARDKSFLFGMMLIDAIDDAHEIQDILDDFMISIQMNPNKKIWNNSHVKNGFECEEIEMA